MSQYVSLKHRLETIIARCETLLVEHPLWVAEHFNGSLILNNYIGLLRFEHIKRQYYTTQLYSLRNWLQQMYDATEGNTYILPTLKRDILFIDLSIHEINGERLTRSKSTCL